MKNLLFVLSSISFITIIFLSVIPDVQAQSLPDLIITELLPNPVGTDSQGEFIELYNRSNLDININEFTIEGRSILPYPGETLTSIPPENFFLIHDDNFDIKQNFPGEYLRGIVTSTSLSNIIDTVELRHLGILEDKVIYSSSQEGQSLIRPLFECENLISIYNSDSNPTQTSINSLENVFDYEGFFPKLEIYDNSWTENLIINTFPKQARFSFQVNDNCSIDTSTFTYRYSNDTPKRVNNVEEFSIISAGNITLEYPESDSTKVFSIVSLPEIVINEIYLIPQSEIDPNNNLKNIQWIELFSQDITSEDILTYYLLDNNDARYDIGNILSSSGGFFVISVSPAIPSTANILELHYSSGELIDTVTFQEPTNGESLSLDGATLVSGWEFTPGATNRIKTNPSLTYSDIRINEVLPNPTSGETEWLEIYNFGTLDVDLTGWKLSDQSSSQTFNGITLKKDSYLLIDDDDLKISLNNSGDQIYLYNPNGVLVSEFEYETVGKDISISYFDGNYKETSKQTPDAKNVLVTIKDVDADDETEKKETSFTSTSSTNTHTTSYPSTIRINEIFPNPDRNNDEWIEIYNFGNEEINLENWILKDLSSSQKLSNTIIKGNSYLVIPESDLKISLNNTGDEISLLDPNEKVVSTFVYKNTTQNNSQIYFEDEILETVDVTKGAENIYSKLDTTTTKKQSQDVNKTQEEEQNKATQVNYISSSPKNIDSINYKLGQDYRKIEKVEEKESKSQNQQNVGIGYPALFSLSLYGLWETPKSKEIFLALIEKLVKVK